MNLTRAGRNTAPHCGEGHPTMADKNDGGDKTEQPTHKRLEDARKKGDVSKSREVTSTVVLLVWLGIGALTVTYATARIGALFESLFVTLGQGWAGTGYVGVLRTLGWRESGSFPVR